MAKGVEKNQAIIDSMALNHTPVFLTSFTTILGFLGLNFSAVPNYHDLGNMTAIGVVVAYLLSVTTLPALVAVLPWKVKPRADHAAKKTDVFTGFVKRRASTIIVVTALGFITSLFVIPKMEAFDEPIKYFSEKMEFRQDTDYTVEHLTGVQTIQLALPATTGSVADPAYLADLDKLKAFIETQPEVVHVSVLSDTMKRLNKSMNGDDQAYYRLPQDQELAAQYLLLYELSLPRGLDLGNSVNLDKSASRISITLANPNTSQLIEITDNVFHWIDGNTQAIGKSVAGSPYLMFAHISKSNISNMLTGTLVTFLMITLSIMVALRSFGYGILGMVTNVLPSVMACGIWAVLVTKADMAVAIATTATIGIIVDFSVHFLSKYSKFRKTQSVEDSIHTTMTMVAPAILGTAVILAAGFSVLMLSQFRLNLVLGALSALTIVMATLAVFLVLPALLVKFDKKSS